MTKISNYEHNLKLNGTCHSESAVAFDGSDSKFVIEAITHSTSVSRDEHVDAHSEI